MFVAITGRAADSPYRKSARVGHSNIVTFAIFKKVSITMLGNGFSVLKRSSPYIKTPQYLLGRFF